MQSVRLVHYNDAYTATGTAARLKALIDELSTEKPTLVTCAGDVFNPSLLSTLTKGKHVPPLLKLLGTRVYTVGNHGPSSTTTCDWSSLTRAPTSVQIVTLDWLCSRSWRAPRAVTGSCPT